MIPRHTCFARAATGGALFIALLAPAVGAQESYPERLADGLRHLHEGQPQLAGTALQDALRLDANDAAGWNAYGALMLETGRLAEASGCFRRAAALAEDDATSRMGLGLCALAQRSLRVAETYFDEAARRGSSAAVAHQAYVAALSGQTARAHALLASAPAIPLTHAVRAYLCSDAGRSATDEWRMAIHAADEASNDHAPMVASFLAPAPLARGWKTDRSIPAPPKLRGPVLSGIVPLSGGDAADIASVTFAIDGFVAGVTNVQPFTWNWNTSQVPNGTHIVRITVRKLSGATSVRERRVQTRNAAAAAAPEYRGMGEVHRVLTEMLSLPPDPRFARLALARAAMENGNSAEARRRLEAVVGNDPTYHNAVNLLRELPRTASTDEIWHGPLNSKRIALTFDDGPQPDHTPQLLDVLARLHTPATFFVVGKQAAAYPDIVRRMAREGHEVENHTWHHKNLRRMTEMQAISELASTRRLIGMLTGRPTRFFRPPGGNISMAARRGAAILDMEPIMWTFASGKAEGLPLEEMVPRFVKAARPGGIYLIHNGTDKIEALIPIVVNQLRARGYEFVTVRELVTTRREPSAHTATAASGSAG